MSFLKTVLSAKSNEFKTQVLVVLDVVEKAYPNQLFNKEEVIKEVSKENVYLPAVAIGLSGKAEANVTKKEDIEISYTPDFEIQMNAFLTIMGNTDGTIFSITPSFVYKGLKKEEQEEYDEELPLEEKDLFNYSDNAFHNKDLTIKDVDKFISLVQQRYATYRNGMIEKSVKSNSPKVYPELREELETGFPKEFKDLKKGTEE